MKGPQSPVGIGCGNRGRWLLSASSAQMAWEMAQTLRVSLPSWLPQHVLQAEVDVSSDLPQRATLLLYVLYLDIRDCVQIISTISRSHYTSLILYSRVHYLSLWAVRELLDDITTAGSLVHRLEKSYFVAMTTCMVTRSVIAIATEMESSLFMAGSVVVNIVIAVQLWAYEVSQSGR